MWFTKSRLINGRHALYQQFRSELEKERSLLEDQDTDRRIIHHIVIEWEVLVCIFWIHTMYDQGAVVATEMNHWFLKILGIS